MFNVSHNRVWVCFVFLLFLTEAQALYIPRRLSRADRDAVIHMLGFGTAQKYLTNPYPLGGYPGLEVGVSYETINIEDLSKLGCAVSGGSCPDPGNPTQSDFRYPRLSLGKGIYNDVDIFLDFLPPLPGTRITAFGGFFRWGFYQGEIVPFNLAATVHATRISIQDQITNQTYGFDLMIGLNINNFSIYFGSGMGYAEAKFTGGDSGYGVIDPADPNLNINTNTLTQQARSQHTVFGATFHFSDYFIAAQMDRYRDPVYSAKFGVRFN